MKKDSKWIAISYTVPPMPSKGRVYVWRKLREYGANPLNQSVSILPNSVNNLKKLQILKKKILSFDGSAYIFYVDFLEQQDDAEIAEEFKEQTEIEFKNIISQCKNFVTSIKNKTQHEKEFLKTAREINKSYKKAKEKQFYPEDLSKELEDGILELKTALKESAAEFHKEFKDLF